jgi:uncharacterized protein (DUF1499 family)
MQYPVLAAMVLVTVVMDCPGSPNCVSSQAADPARRVDPLRYPQGRKTEAMRALKRILENQPRTEIVSQSGDTIQAVATSALFRFKDDLEFHCDPDHPVIHVRSASRVGYWDLGVNRKRVERIRSAFARLLADQP